MAAGQTQARPIRGVNLGGWLVLEKWITPTLFDTTDAVDEYTFCKDGSKAVLQKLKTFRDSFVTKADFEWLAQQGIEAVRLPIGYWAFGHAQPYVPTVSYIDNAFRWAEETGLKILLDLHGAYRSQNGDDHSGQSGKTQWHQDATSIAKTVEVIQQLGNRYGKHPALLGISLLNEPGRTIPKSLLLDYYKQAYGIIRRTCGDHVWIVYSDGYMPRRWRKELPASTYQNVYIDTHHYQVFTPLDKLLSPKLHMVLTRVGLPRKLAELLAYHPVIVGEWSLTLSSKALQKFDTTKQKYVAQQYAQAQLTAFQPTAAWFFWTYKTDPSSTWNFRDCIEKGYFSSF